MQVTIIPGSVAGTLQAPASKSVMQRACAAALLRNGETLIHNYGRSEDDRASLRIIQEMGAVVEEVDDLTLRISSEGRIHVNPDASLHCGESGLALRMFTPIAALSAESITISGEGSLTSRPAGFLADVLSQLGVAVQLNDGKLPLQLKGPLQPGNITVDGSLTSQMLTGMLMAYSAGGGSGTITVQDLKSRPYIDLTLKVMEDFKMRLPLNEQYHSFRFAPVTEEKVNEGILSFTVEGDWSNAAFLLVAGAVAGSVTVKGLDVFTTQADKKILEALQDCGCRLSIQAEEITTGHQPLKAFHFDATDCPDLFPPLVALAACCAGTSVLEGVHRLAHKESNRAVTLQQEFQKLGIDITVQDDKMIIKGGAAIQAASVQSHHDHRIAMACAVAALRATGPVAIDDAEAVGKSYPAFWAHLSVLTGQELAPQYSNRPSLL